MAVNDKIFDLFGYGLFISLGCFILMTDSRKGSEIAYSEFKEDTDFIYAAPIIAVGMLVFGFTIMVHLASIVASTRLQVISSYDKVVSRLILIVFCAGFVFANIKLMNDHNILADHLDKLQYHTSTNDHDKCYFISSKIIRAQSSERIDVTYEHPTGLNKSIYYKIDTTDVPDFVDCWVYNQTIYLREVTEIGSIYKYTTVLHTVCYFSNTLIVILSVLEILCTSESKYMCVIFGNADHILVRNTTYKIAKERNLIHHYQGPRLDCNLIM